MTQLLKVLFFGACIGMAGCALAAENVPQADVRDLMSARQFQQAGLAKLSPQELAALNAWLDQYLQSQARPASVQAAAPSPAPHPHTTPKPAAPVQPATGAEAGFGAPPAPPPEEPETPDRIVSQIDGKFDGFYSGAIFKLANGQVWKETDSRVFKINLDNPKVVIKKVWSGYLMRLGNYGTQVFVRRIK